MSNIISKIYNHTPNSEVKEKLRYIKEQILVEYQKKAINMLNFDVLIEDAALYENLAREIASNYKQLIIVGIGASTLNPNLFSSFKKNDVEILLLDNIDIYAFEKTLEKIDFTEAFTLLISKSGETLETVVLTRIMLQQVESKSGVIDAKNYLAITDNLNSELGKIADSYGIPIISPQIDIGGRFSVFAISTMMCLMIYGIDAASIIEYARKSVEKCLSNDNIVDISEFHITSAKCGKSIIVNMIYPTKLFAYNDWYRQIIAESLGKHQQAMTPVRAFGTIDQHSQLQLYLDGPADKIFTFITTEETNNICFNEKIIPDSKLSFLQGKNFSQVIKTMQQSTIKLIHNKEIPYCHINISTLTEEHLVNLIIETMLTTLFISRYYDINPYGQPAVEEGKSFALNLLKDHA